MMQVAKQDVRQDMLHCSAVALTKLMTCASQASGTHRVDMHAATSPGGLPAGRTGDLATHGGDGVEGTG